MSDRVFRAVGSCLLACAFGITALIYVPVLWLGLLSISASPLSGMPGGFTTQWYVALVAHDSWLPPMLRSVEIATIVSILCVLASLPTGRALPHMQRGRLFMAGCLLLPLGVPGTVLGLLVFIYYRMIFGVHMGIGSLMLSHFIWAFPFALIAMLVVTSRFDTGLLEAAADLGASSWRRFWDIERPLLMPGIISAALFGFLLSFTELPRSIFVAGEVQTLPLYSWTEASAHSSQVPLIFCLNSIVTLVSIAASIVMVTRLKRKTC